MSGRGGRREAERMEKRAEALNELLETEYTYLSSLDVALRYFFYPLLESTLAPEPILPKEQVFQIFSNAVDLALVNHEFYDHVKKTVATLDVPTLIVANPSSKTGSSRKIGGTLTSTATDNDPGEPEASPDPPSGEDKRPNDDGEQEQPAGEPEGKEQPAEAEPEKRKSKGPMFDKMEKYKTIESIVLPEIPSFLTRIGDPDVEVGDILLAEFPHFEVYHAYVGNYPDAQATLAEAREDPEFVKWLDKVAQDNPSEVTTSLESYLIGPVQRLPRYQLILKELIKTTSRDSPDAPKLKKALAMIKEQSENVNKAMRTRQNLRKLMKIQSSFVGSLGRSVENIVDEDRIHVKDGELVKISRRSPQRRVFFLFTDILVYGNPLPNGKILFHRKLWLDHMSVEPVPDDPEDETEHGFQIVTKEKSFVVCAKSEMEKDSWVRMLKNTIAKAKKAAEVARSRTPSMAADLLGKRTAPVWIPDTNAPECMMCNTVFTLFRRRHHCRHCGKVICDKCSQERIFLPNVDGTKPSRVCDSCFYSFSLAHARKDGELMTRADRVGASGGSIFGSAKNSLSAIAANRRNPPRAKSKGSKGSSRRTAGSKGSARSGGAKSKGSKGSGRRGTANRSKSAGKGLGRSPTRNRAGSPVKKGSKRAPPGGHRRGPSKGAKGSKGPRRGPSKGSKGSRGRRSPGKPSGAKRAGPLKKT